LAREGKGSDAILWGRGFIDECNLDRNTMKVVRIILEL
jgi:hypothetical protein